jgi:sialate O-acetylesterase
MAVAIDIGEVDNIHPSNKQDVGKRLSLSALAKDYGKDIVYSGPLYKSMKKEGSKIRIEFDHVGSGLMVAQKQGLDPAKETPGAELAHFAIQDVAGAWHWAKAAIDGNSVLVWNDEVKDPTHVHFVSVLRSPSSHKRRKSPAYDVYDYDQRIIYLCRGYRCLPLLRRG